MLKYLVVSISLVTSAAIAADVTDCDRLASHPEDPDRVSAAVETSDLKFAPAIAACRADVAHDPGNGRLHYQLGRLLFYNKQNEEAVKEVRAAADAGYRQAQFVFGAFINNGRPFAPTDVCQLEHYWRLSADAGRQAARISYVRHALKGKFAECDHQASVADLMGYVDAASAEKPDYYLRLLIADVREQLAQAKGN